jgi:hypothetical protein
MCLSTSTTSATGAGDGSSPGSTGCTSRTPPARAPQPDRRGASGRRAQVAGDHRPPLGARERGHRARSRVRAAGRRSRASPRAASAAMRYPPYVAAPWRSSRRRPAAIRAVSRPSVLSAGHPHAQRDPCAPALGPPPGVDSRRSRRRSIRAWVTGATAACFHTFTNRCTAVIVMSTSMPHRIQTSAPSTHGSRNRPTQSTTIRSARSIRPPFASSPSDSALARWYEMTDDTPTPRTEGRRDGGRGSRRSSRRCPRAGARR